MIGVGKHVPCTTGDSGVLPSSGVYYQDMFSWSIVNVGRTKGRCLGRSDNVLNWVIDGGRIIILPVISILFLF